MKATYLMIGDWVHCAKLDYAPENYVANMQVKQLHIADLDTYSFKELKYEEIEPIPLTSEILEKNGFNKVIDRCKIDTYHDRKNCVNIIMFSTPVVTILQESFVINKLKIQYVHELQHALKLCGIEKEIEL